MGSVLIFIVVDAPLSMNGEPISQFQKLIEKFIKNMRNDPNALELAYVSVISTNSHNSEVVLPLISIEDLVSPDLFFNCAGKSDIFKGLDQYKLLFDSNFIKPTIVKKGDYGAVLVLLAGTIPQNNFPKDYLDCLDKNLRRGTLKDPLSFLYDSEYLVDESLEQHKNKISKAEIIYYRNSYVGNY